MGLAEPQARIRSLRFSLCRLAKVVCVDLLVGLALTTAAYVWQSKKAHSRRHVRFKGKQRPHLGLRAWRNCTLCC